MAVLRITLEQARHAWMIQQRLIGPAVRKRTVAEIVGDIGWIAMTAPATPYVSLFVRGAIQRRAELDDRRVETSVVPGPRGSSWLVPTADAPLARAFAVADHASREARIAAATTLTSSDLDTAHDALRSAMVAPTTRDEIRQKLPATALRTLGEPGRKAGMPTVAALVMRNMWVTGEIMRVADAGRLDSAVVRWGVDPRPRTVPTAADAVNEIAPRWLAAYAPVTARTFAAAFGIAAGRANAAFDAITPLHVEIDGVAGMFLAPADFAAPAAGSKLGAKLVPRRDPLTDVHLPHLCSDEAARQAQTRSNGVAPIVLSNGEAVGSWSYDAARRAIAWRAFGAATSDVDEIEAEATRVAAFISSELGANAFQPTPPPTARGRAHAAAEELLIEF